MHYLARSPIGDGLCARDQLWEDALMRPWRALLLVASLALGLFCVLWALAPRGPDALLSDAGSDPVDPGPALNLAGESDLQAQSPLPELA